MITIPVNEPDLSGQEQAYVLDAVKSGWISGGPYVERFERDFAKFIGTRYAITTTSGTVALQLALTALRIGPGDEVIIPAFTMAATAFAVCAVGATPVLVDAEPDIFTLDPALIEAKITGRTRAIIPVHLYGHPADMDPIDALARRYGLSVVEDAAEAHGARYRGRACGALGVLNCFSLYANKIVTTGEGGVLTTDDAELAGRVAHLKDMAHAPEQRFVHTEVAFTQRMTNLQAAIGVAQLERVAQFIERKRTMAALYGRALAGVPGLELPLERPWASGVYWMYAVRVTSAFGGDRDELARRLERRGIGTRTFFVPMHRQPALLGRGLFTDERYPVADRLAREGLYLPSGLTIRDDQIVAVADAIRAVGHELRR